MDSYELKTVVQLKNLLKERGLKTVGKKDELIKRLKTCDLPNLLHVNVKVLSGTVYRCEMQFKETISCLKLRLFELSSYKPQNQVIYSIVNRRTSQKDVVLSKSEFGKIMDDEVVVGSVGKDEIWFMMHCVF